jgi:hypothetical protein
MTSASFLSALTSFCSKVTGGVSTCNDEKSLLNAKIATMAGQWIKSQRTAWNNDFYNKTAEKYCNMHGNSIDPKYIYQADCGPGGGEIACSDPANQLPSPIPFR